MRYLQQKLQFKKRLTAELFFSSVIVCAILLCVIISTVSYSSQAAAVINKAAMTKADLPVVTPQEVRYIQLEDPLLVLVNYEVSIPEGHSFVPAFIGDEMFDIRMYDNLTALIDDASHEGLILWIASAYRSVEDQDKILARAIEENLDAGSNYKTAEKNALKTIAKPGHSEHHTGLVIDFNTVTGDFRETGEYDWLQAHAHEYGFVQRYRADKTELTGIDEEVWHYRYVGKEHAMKMTELAMCLEEYCTYLKGRGIA